MIGLEEVDKKRWLPVAIAATGVLIFLLLIITKTHPKPAKVAERAWNVSVMTAELGNYTPNVVLHGTVETPRDATLKAAVEADVWSTPIREGEPVSKGQLIIQLDPRDAELILRQRIGEVKNLEAQIVADKIRNETDIIALKDEKRLLKLGNVSLKRQIDLREHTSKEAVDKATEEVHRRQLDVTVRERSIREHEHRIAALEAQLLREESLKAQAELDLQRTRILAPFTGRLGKLFVAVGDRVRPGDDLARVYDTSALEVRAEIPSQYLPEVRQALNMAKTLYADTRFDSQTVRLKLHRLASTVAGGRSGVDALFVLVKPNNQLELGRTVTVRLHLPEQKNIVAIPSEALYGLDKVYIIKQQRLVAVPIKRLGSVTQPDGQKKVLIASPKLQSGDQIVTTQLPNAVTGLKVTVVK